MSYTLNDKIKNLVPYEPISGDYDIRLDANECTLNYDGEFLKTVHKVVDEMNFNRYPDPSCTELRRSFASYYGIDYKNVTVGNGSDELIFLIESAFMMKGETLLCASPDFSMYAFYSSITENGCVNFAKNDELEIDADEFIALAKKENASVVIFSNPCNPTGQGMKKSDALKIVSSLDALVVVDEAYMDFYDENESLLGEVNNYDNLVVFRTASKALGSAALRLGFAVACEATTNALAAVKSPYNVNSFSQAIGTELYKNKIFLKNRTKTIVQNTKLLYNKLVELGEQVSDFRVYPTKTNFVFVKTPDSKAIWEYLKERSIVIRCMGDYIRVTAGTVEEIEKTVDEIKNYFSER